MDFKRDVWKELLYWKNNMASTTLEVRGARQVGKTYILKKFCVHEFSTFIYINMAEESGRIFLQCADQVFQQKNTAFDLSKLMKSYADSYTDSADTVVLIDEIQESSRVYNMVRSFTRQLAARFIITGSYLGKILDKEFFLPAGDLSPVTMYPLSFPEFLDIFHLREEHQKLYDRQEVSDELKKYFQIYTMIGGYPSVIIRFVETKDVSACFREVDRIMDTFIAESARYFDSVVDEDVFRTVIMSICQLSMTEKKGKNLIEDLHKIVSRPGNSRISKSAIDHAIGWLHRSSIIGYAQKLIDGQVLKSVLRARCYFHDLGVSFRLGMRSGFSMQELHGYIAETYVYQTLRNRYYRACIYTDVERSFVIGESPAFSIYQKNSGELDFVLFGSLGGYKNGIEVKWSTDSAVTGSEMLKDGLIDHLYLLMGDCRFLEDGNVRKIPLYFADLIEYPLLKEEMYSFAESLNEITI